VTVKHPSTRKARDISHVWGLLTGLCREGSEFRAVEFFFNRSQCCSGEYRVQGWEIWSLSYSYSQPDRIIIISTFWSSYDYTGFSGPDKQEILISTVVIDPVVHSPILTSTNRGNKESHKPGMPFPHCKCECIFYTKLYAPLLTGSPASTYSILSCMLLYSRPSRRVHLLY
jgi:hypothetical protein